MGKGLFYILSAVILVFSFMTVTTPRILRAAVYLLFVLIATSGIYFLLDYGFLAAVQLIVYAGGIVVLIIFSILLTNQINDRLPKPGSGRMIFGGIAAALGAFLTISTLITYPFQTSTAQPTDTSVSAIGTQMLSYGEGGYVLPFELISVLLLAAMIGAIIIAKRVNETN